MTSLAFVKRVFVTRIIMDIGFVRAAQPSIPSIPVIGQDMPQQYLSASYRAAGECVEGKQHGYLLMPPSVYPTDVLVQPAYTLMLSSELANESSQIPIRNAAALALKNNLSARIQYTTRRLSLDNDTKAKIKQEVLVTLASPLLGAGGFAQVVTAIASIVFPHDQWPDLIKLVLLLSFMNNLTNTNLRIAVEWDDGDLGVYLRSPWVEGWGSVRPKGAWSCLVQSKRAKKGQETRPKSPKKGQDTRLENV
ncbi:hypothetical protein EDD15DRAFT_2419234 [Pisolithus albus]|nr:hypothetical protein EDD15DRAFT_2419234 [Pisolithus albus]